MSEQLAVELTEEERERLTAFFDEGAAKFDPKDAYWIDFDSNDAGDDYCRACANKKLAMEIAKYRRLPKATKSKTERPRMGGGYSAEHDSTPFCETCSALLDGSLTDYGCESEVEHFTRYGFDITSDDDRRAMAEVIQSRGWKTWLYREHLSDFQRKQDDQYVADLHKLGRQILNALDAAKQPDTLTRGAKR